MSLFTYSYRILKLLKKVYRQRFMMADFARCTSQVRVRLRFFCFFFCLFFFASFLSKAVIVILPFITMCHLMFEALNMNEILLSTRSREFIVQQQINRSPHSFSPSIISLKGFVQCSW